MIVFSSYVRETWTSEFSDMMFAVFNTFKSIESRTRTAKRDSGGLIVYY